MTELNRLTCQPGMKNLGFVSAVKKKKIFGVITRGKKKRRRRESNSLRVLVHCSKAPTALWPLGAISTSANGRLL